MQSKTYKLAYKKIKRDSRMKKRAFWKADWFLVLTVAIVLFFMGGGDLIQSLEHKAYDLGVRAS